MSKIFLIGIIILLLLLNCYFYWQNQSIESIIGEFKTIDTNENEYQFSIFPMELGWGEEDYNDYDKCVKEQNKCADDYKSLIEQIDKILEK